ncbi:thiol-disulfide oxidoreductase DCC family protein [Microlunatus capsulatus]|uniref:DCC family thiol-disulfide oxidoreductase YuxK n=1 Tax=Microlunatus capsulatus TaxID=99117 RepID=A0ABS4Z4H5_9ACTN|nr:DCC1-like thiol-disulfide oxidoreductase family protein [Microlunatus capsulatus]MBP2415946.1 putative DCC family thiol-disulfide oxidoreductase YuxK [Microlunatus capsulatus]
MPAAPGSPAPTAPRDRPWLVFDGDCAFCTTSATWVAERLHRPSGPDALLVPWQFTDLDALGTTAERAQTEVLWVEPDGAVAGGAAAFAAWLRFRGGAYALLGRAMGLPLVRPVAAAVYRLVARNRSRMPGGTPACALPPPGSAPAPR